MDILIVSSTFFEIKPLLGFLQIPVQDTKFFSTTFYTHKIDFLITGIGNVAMVYHLSEVLNTNRYDLIINAGVAGSYEKFQIGDVVRVVREEFGDLGVEYTEDFKTVFEIGITKPDEKPFTNGKLVKTSNKFDKYFADLPEAKSLTMNTVSGREPKIEFLKKKFNADIESMEGAGFFYVCLMKNADFIEIRSISNFVRPFNRESWQLLTAQSALNETLKMKLLEILKDN